MELTAKTTLGIIVAAFALFGLLLFGFSGLRLLVLSAIVFVLPVYLILGNFGLESIERVFFSIFLGLVLVPVPVYWLGTLISFRLSIAIVALALLGLGFFMNKHRSKHHERRDEPDMPLDVESQQP